MSEYTRFLNCWAANAERLYRVGIVPFGFDPGFMCNIEGCRGGVDIPEPLANIICDLVKKVYPEIEDDKAMIAEYKKRQAYLVKKMRDAPKKK